MLYNSDSHPDLTLPLPPRIKQGELTVETRKTAVWKGFPLLERRVVLRVSKVKLLPNELLPGSVSAKWRGLHSGVSVRELWRLYVSMAMEPEKRRITRL